MKYVLALCSLLAVVWSGQAWATTRYVAQTGSDAVTCANSSTISTPKLTFVSALACMVPGDTLYVRAGTWTTPFVTTALSGTPGNYITIAAYPGEVVTIRTTAAPIAGAGTYGSTHAYMIFDGFVFDGVNSDNMAGIAIGQGAHHWILRNNEMKSWKSFGITLGCGSPQIAPDNIQILNNTIHDQVSLTGASGTRWYGIYFSCATNSSAIGNNVYNNPGGGIQVYNTGPANSLSNNIISRNKIHDNNTLTASNVGGVIVGGTPVNTEISGNWIYNNGSSPTSGAQAGVEVQFGPNGTKIWNNTIYGNKGIGVNIATSSVTNTVLQNNIVYLNTDAISINDVGTNTTKDHNITTNPTFVNVGTLDFSLQSTSNAINTGTTTFVTSAHPCNGVCDVGTTETFGFSTAVVNDVLMDVTLGMNANVPVLPATGITGFTVACSGGSNCGTPVVASAIKRAGSDSIVRLTISGMGGGGVCEIGQTWTVTYTPGNVSDSALIGTTSNSSNQKMFGFTTQPVTNACAGVPPVTSTITLEGTAVQSQAGTGTTVALQCGSSDNRFVFVSVGVRDSTNSMSGITYNGVALTQVGSKVVNSSVGLTVQAFYLANAASGSNTLSMTMSASDNWAVVASCWSGVDTSVPIGTPVTATSVNAAGSITATATGVTDGIILDAIAKDFQGTVCVEDPSQTEVVADGRTDGGAVRTQSSYKSGVGSVVMTWTGCTAFGGEAQIAVPVYPATTPTPPAVGTFTQAAHQFYSAYTQGGQPVPLSAISAANTSIRAGVPFAITTQLDCTGADCDPVGLRLRYSRNGAPFVRVPDVMDSNQIAFIGNVPAATVLRGAVSCCLSGALTPIAGTTQLTMDATPVVDLAQNASTVQRRVLVLGPDAVNGDTYDFEEYNQDLNPLDAYVPSGGARITVSTTQIAQVTDLHLVGPTAHSTLVGLVWSPSTDPFLQGYKVYRSTTSGVYGEAVHTITEATAGATMSPMTQWIHNEPVANTYYFVVKAFDWGGLESIVSSEVTVVKTGQGARRTR